MVLDEVDIKVDGAVEDCHQMADLNNIVNDGTLTAPLPPQQRAPPLQPPVPRPGPGQIPIRQLPLRQQPIRAGFSGSSTGTFFPPSSASVGPSGGRPPVPPQQPPVQPQAGSSPVVNIQPAASGVPGVGPQQGPGTLRQPRPLFAFPSIRLPNLSDLFGL